MRMPGNIREHTIERYRYQAQSTHAEEHERPESDVLEHGRGDLPNDEVVHLRSHRSVSQAVQRDTVVIPSWTMRQWTCP